MTPISKFVPILFSLAFFNIACAKESSISNNSDNALNNIKLTNKLSYHNQNQKSPTQEFVLLDMENGKTFSMPVLIGEHNTNSDTLIASIGIDYAVNDKLDIGATADFSYHEHRTNLPTRSSHKQFNDISINTQYQLFDNHKTLPNLNIYSDVSLYDNSNNFKQNWFTSGLIGINTHMVNDPIMISGTASYQIRPTRTSKMGNKIDLGESLALGAMVGFSVNPEISLNAGINWRMTKPQKHNGQIADAYHTQTSLNLGMSYALNVKSNINANIRTNISGQGGSSFSLGITTQLGKLPPSLTEAYRQLKTD